MIRQRQSRRGSGDGGRIGTGEAYQPAASSASSLRRPLCRAASQSLSSSSLSSVTRASGVSDDAQQCNTCSSNCPCVFWCPVAAGPVRSLGRRLGGQPSRARRAGNRALHALHRTYLGGLGLEVLFTRLLALVAAGHTVLGGGEDPDVEAESGSGYGPAASASGTTLSRWWMDTKDGRERLGWLRESWVCWGCFLRWFSVSVSGGRNGLGGCARLLSAAAALVGIG